MWRIGFIKSIHMREARERLGPLIASMLYFFWNFYVFYKLTEVPDLFKSFLLGVFISAALLFMISIFAKVSMHVAGWGGAITILCIANLVYPCSLLMYLLIAVVATVLVIAARLGLQAHTKAEVISGLIVGVISQLVAFGFFRMVLG